MANCKADVFTPGGETEAELIARAKQGDEAAFACLVHTFSPTVNRLVSSYPPADRKDLSQEGLMGLFKAVLLFDPAVSSFSTFATLCIRCGIVDGARKLSREDKPLSPQLADSLADEIANPERIFLGKEALASLLETVERSLSPLEQKVLRLHLSGKKNGEIAHLLGKDVKSVENTLFRLRKKLQALSR